MELRRIIHDWGARIRDRARVRSFGRFLVRRIMEDNVFQAAGALAYTTVFALVPLSMVVFGVLSGFPVFAEWSERLSDYIFSNFVPSAARSMESWLLQLSGNVGQLTAAGTVALVASLLITLNGVEATFNRIWRVSSARPRITRFLVYWTVLTLGALLAAASLALSTRFFALAVFDTVPGVLLEQNLLRLAPMALELLVFTAIYKVVPHRTVQLRHAVAGATLAVVLFELVRWGIGVYLGLFTGYARIYGTLAFVPVFLIWVFLGWVAVLLGASVAAAISAFRYQPAALRIPEGYELYGLLRLLGRFDQARVRGEGLHSEQIVELEPVLTDALVQEMLGQLESIRVVTRAESGEWVLARDLDTLSLAELYEAGAMRIPVAEAHLPHQDDALGRGARGALDELRVPLRELLKRRVSSIHSRE